MTWIGRIEKVERSDFRKLDKFVFLQLGDAEDKVVDGSEGLLITRADDCAPGGFVETADITEADA